MGLYASLAVVLRALSLAALRASKNAMNVAQDMVFAGNCGNMVKIELEHMLFK